MIRVTPLYGSVGHHPSCPITSVVPISCIVEYGSFRILVDVGWDESTMSFYKSFPLNVADLHVDCILLCNSTLSSIGGLPLLYTEYKKKYLTFPTVYCTFPTVKMGQMTLYDLHANLCLDGGKVGFDLEDVDEVFSRVETLKYSQSVVLEKKLSVCSHRSGCVVGGSFWILKRLVDETEVVICPMYNHVKETHLASSDLLKFSAPDVLITTPGGPGNGVANFGRGKLIPNLMSALRRGGNVLIPVDASGRVLEVVLQLSRHWEKHRLSSTYNLCCK